jgi:hypothetical protein
MLFYISFHSYNYQANYLSSTLDSITPTRTHRPTGALYTTANLVSISLFNAIIYSSLIIQLLKYAFVCIV